MREAEQYADEDRRVKETAEVRNQAETLTYSTEKFIKENAEKLPEDLKKEVEDAIAEVKKDLEGTDTDAIKASAEKLATSSQKLGAALYAQQQADGSAEAPTDQATADNDDEVVDAEIVDDEKDAK
jgi:molecular chaperone DnaK